MRVSKPENTAILCALIACAASAVWMAAVVRFDYAGNWTAFYRTGAGIHLPARSAGENLYLLRGAASGGYDGQYYRLIAQDPGLTHGTDRFIDAPRLRYRRILVPALAWFAALGDPTRSTYTYIPVVLTFLGLGAYWLSRYAARCGLNPWCGLAFVLAPAAFISIDRLTVDIALAALTVAFALYWDAAPLWKLYLVLLFAPLSKETGIFFIGAYCLYALTERLWTRAFVIATAAVPSALWFLYVQSRTARDATAWIRLPFQSVFEAMFHPELLPGRPWYIVPLDYLSWIGLVLAILLAFFRWRSTNPLPLAAVMYAVLAASIDFNVWQEVEGFGRAFTPLLILLPFTRRDWISLCPLLFLLPRALVFPFSETMHMFAALAK
jgi:hypothetical protein